MKKEIMLHKIKKIMYENLYAETLKDGSGVNMIQESQIPFIADDILNGFADVVSQVCVTKWCQYCKDVKCDLIEIFNKCKCRKQN